MNLTPANERLVSITHDAKPLNVLKPRDDGFLLRHFPFREWRKR